MFAFSYAFHNDVQEEPPSVVDDEWHLILLGHHVALENCIDNQNAMWCLGLELLLGV